jgi:hypothetical protein
MLVLKSRAGVSAPASGDKRGPAGSGRQTSRGMEAGPQVGAGASGCTYPPPTESGASGRTVQSSDLSTTRWCARLANLRTAPAIRLRPASVLSRVSRRAADRHRAGDRSRGKAQAWRRSRGSLESASSGAGAQLIPGTSALPQQRQSSLAWTAMDCCFLSRLDGAKRVGEQFCSDAEGTERPAER